MFIGERFTFQAKEQGNVWWYYRRKKWEYFCPVTGRLAGEIIVASSKAIFQQDSKLKKDPVSIESVQNCLNQGEYILGRRASHIQSVSFKASLGLKTQDKVWHRGTSCSTFVHMVHLYLPWSIWCWLLSHTRWGTGWLLWPMQLGTESAAQWVLSLSFLSSHSRSERGQMDWESSLCHHHGLTSYLDELWLSVTPECNILHPPAFCTQPFRDQLPSHPEITLTAWGRWHLLNICTVAGCLWA